MEDKIEKIELIETKKKSVYNKEAVYKWREANREKYLISQHLYQKKKYADPESKVLIIQQVKAYQEKKKNERIANGEVLRKNGRPSKYNIPVQI